MIIFVNGATKTMRRHWGHPNLGCLFQPGNWGQPTDAERSGVPWAADNGAYGGWSHEKEMAYIRMISRFAVAPHENMRFVTAPDVVGDRLATWKLWREWLPKLTQCGLPTAYVLQDGERGNLIPYDSMDALFVGGTTEFKLSEQCEEEIRQALSCGKWVHIGRVNSKCRLRHFWEIGAHSIDGTNTSKWPDTHIPNMLRWLRGLDEQPICEGH